MSPRCCICHVRVDGSTDMNQELTDDNAVRKNEVDMEMEAAA